MEIIHLEYKNNNESNDFRMHPRRMGANSNSYYAAKNTLRNNGQNSNSGCGTIFYIIIIWFFCFWIMFLIGVKSGREFPLSIVITILILCFIHKIGRSNVNCEDTSDKDDISRTEFFQQYEFKRYVPDKYQYVLGISIGRQIWKFTIEDIRNMWVEYDSDPYYVIIHFPQNEFKLAHRDNMSDIEHIIDFIRSCAGIDLKERVPTSRV